MRAWYVFGVVGVFLWLAGAIESATEEEDVETDTPPIIKVAEKEPDEDETQPKGVVNLRDFKVI